MSTKEETKAAP